MNRICQSQSRFSRIRRQEVLMGGGGGSDGGKQRLLANVFALPSAVFGDVSRPT